jgi:hypothetical protein
MKPLDAEASRDLEVFRKKCQRAKRFARDVNGQLIMKNGAPVEEEILIDVPKWQQPESGNLNPNDRDDLRRLASKASEGVEVVEAAPKQEVVEKVVSLE